MTKQNGNGAKDEKRERPYNLVVRDALCAPKFVQLLTRAIPTGVQLDPMALVWQAINVIETPDERTGELKLLACDLPSIRRAVLKAATLGLQFQGECYLIPYGANCNFQTSIWGEIHIVERTGRLKNVWADVIYEADPYRIVRGMNPELFHDITSTWGLPGSNIPIGDTKEIIEVGKGGRGRPLGAYACAKLDDGEVRWAAISEAEMAVARGNAASKGSPAHRDWPDEMRKKMAFRRAQKTWPHVPLLATAQALEGDGDLDETKESALRTITVEGQPVAAQVTAALEAPKPRPGDDLVSELRNRQRETAPARRETAPAEVRPQAPPERRTEPDPHGDPEPPEPTNTAKPGREPGED